MQDLNKDVEDVHNILQKLEITTEDAWMGLIHSKLDLIIKGETENINVPFILSFVPNFVLLSYIIGEECSVATAEIFKKSINNRNEQLFDAIGSIKTIMAVDDINEATNLLKEYLRLSDGTGIDALYTILSVKLNPLKYKSFDELPDVLEKLLEDVINQHIVRISM